jgi:acyl carrier protein phosphodiesterase
MNYLAHLLLSENTPESRIGNFLGDFVKGSLENYQEIYNQGILKGIRTHRQIDIFTDKHEIYLKSKRRISPDRSRFSGIIIDIFYDYFLANNWHIFSEESLEDFSNNIYKIFQKNKNQLPTKFQQILPRMIQENWLLSYKDINGIALALKRLSKRFTRKNNLENAEEELLSNYQHLEHDFQQFFPDLINFVQDNRFKF